MKRTIIFLMVFVFCLGGYSQSRRVGSKTKARATHTTKTPIPSITESDTKAKENSIRSAEIATNNAKCAFDFSTGSFISRQTSEDFVVYEVPSMSASELKTAVFTILSTLYKSPKDAITNISDNMIQLEGYASRVYYTKAGDDSYGKDILFDMVIQFKDGKVRYNKPIVKMIYTEWPLAGMAKLNMELPLSKLVKESDSRISVQSYFNNLISNINHKIVQSNDW